jgi:hypothetical protein
MSLALLRPTSAWPRLVSLKAPKVGQLEAKKAHLGVSAGIDAAAIVRAVKAMT